MIFGKYKNIHLILISCFCRTFAQEVSIQQDKIIVQQEISEEIHQGSDREAVQVVPQEDELASLLHKVHDAEQTILACKNSIELLRQEIGRLQLQHFGLASDRDQVFALLDHYLEDQKIAVVEKSSAVNDLRNQFSMADIDKKLADQKLLNLRAINKQIKSDGVSVAESISQIKKNIAQLQSVEVPELLKNYQIALDKVQQEKSALEETTIWEIERKREYAQATMQQRVDELENQSIALSVEIDNLSELCVQKEQEITFLQNDAQDLLQEKNVLELQLSERGLPTCVHAQPSQQTVQFYNELTRNRYIIENSEQWKSAQHSATYDATLKDVAEYSFVREDAEALDSVRREQDDAKKTFLERHYVVKAIGSAVVMAAVVVAGCFGYKKMFAQDKK